MMARVEASAPDAMLSQSEARSARPGVGARGAPTSAPRASLVSRSAADGYGSDGSDAGRSTASAAPSRRGDGDSEEEDSGENEARARPRRVDYGDDETAISRRRTCGMTTSTWTTCCEDTVSE